MAEARDLARAGAVELNLVAQDLLAYGSDLAGRPLLIDLLNELATINELSWIRLLYLHPDFVDEALLVALRDTPKVLPYLDMPIQHIADSVLKAMGRRRSSAELKALISRARDLVPGLSLRTTLMTGHPGEGEKEFAQLRQLVQEVRFDHLGVFAYQPEKGTRSARLPAPAPELAQMRADEIMSLQQVISAQKLTSRVGESEDVLVLGPHPDSDLVWHGRARSQAPEVDGLVIITDGHAPAGSIASCRITASHDYDLEGVLI